MDFPRRIEKPWPLWRWYVSYLKQICLIQFWHRFGLTKHSGVYANPDHFKVQIKPVPEMCLPPMIWNMLILPVTIMTHLMTCCRLPWHIGCAENIWNFQLQNLEFAMPDPLVDEYFVQNHLDAQVWQSPRQPTSGLDRL